MAEIKRLPVSENGRPPYWNFISGFEFDVRVVISISFSIYVPGLRSNRTIGGGSYDVISIIQDGGHRETEIYFRVQV